MSNFMLDLLKPQRLSEIVDVGANPIDGDPPYRDMLNDSACRVTGFEPQDAALQKLLATKGENERYLPYAVGDGKRHTLYVCRGSGMTSLLQPDRRTLSLFQTLKPLGDVMEKFPLETKRLDDIEEIGVMDFLKIDIQGSELAVFQNGQNLLAQAVCVQTEVSFVTLYENQPALGEVDMELRKQGFIPHCAAAVKNWPIAPFTAQPVNQLLEADLVYVRDFSRPELMDNEQLKHLALIVHYCYGSFDLVMRCLALLEERNAVPKNSITRYTDWLQEEAKAAASDSEAE